MSAQKRLDALASEIAGVEAEIADLTRQHAEQVTAGQDQKADYLHEQIIGARERLDGATMRRAPLERALQAELDAEQAKVAATLTADADAKLQALEAMIADASEAAAKLAEICDRIDQHAALIWANAARQAVDAGGTPARRHLQGMEGLSDKIWKARQKLMHIASDYSQRSVQIPVPTKSRAA